MKKTKRLMTGVLSTALAVGLSGCGSERLSEPDDSRCRDWDWNSDLGVYECDDDDSGYRGSYYYGGTYYKSKNALKSSSSYKSYSSSSSFKGSSGFGTGSKGGFGG
ncbi:hypothetical protein [Bacillus taeanensis]|uniref:Aminotransferase yhxA n=1 Tax=Bacillus taeanensis TaxID=273032 RepID=A0A366XUM2_9BACI|nr:hypothetical protein [Bacillus taeanensis]RBW67824.1 hypothetical protein DS031_19960 [Bacillus taeanensis]